jgi:transcriptional regulator with XRE-family HTH domain
MAERAGRAGHPISHSHIADYAKGTVKKMPSREDLQALAAALDTGVERVRRAALWEWWEYVPREMTRNAKGARIVAAVPPGLTTEQEQALTRLIQAWAATREES